MPSRHKTINNKKYLVHQAVYEYPYCGCSDKAGNVCCLRKKNGSCGLENYRGYLPCVGKSVGSIIFLNLNRKETK